MALDAVKCLCLESPQGGGTQLDTYPTEISPLTGDALNAAGLFVQSQTSGSEDKLALIDRVGGSMRFTDTVTSHVLGELVSSTTGQVGSHNALLDVVHFLADGPGDGWASGAYCQDTYSGLLLVKSVWYATNAMTTPIVARSYTYTGTQVATDTTTLYNAAGVAIRTVTDTFSYNGLQRASRTRTWS